MALNTAEAKGGPLAKKEVRQAIGYALDYDGYVNGIMGGAAVSPATAVPAAVDRERSGSVQGLYPRPDQGAGTLGLGRESASQEITVSYDTDTVAPGGASYETIAVKVKSDLEQINGCKIKLAPAPGDERLGGLPRGRLPGDAVTLDAGLPGRGLVLRSVCAEQYCRGQARWLLGSGGRQAARSGLVRDSTRPSARRFTSRSRRR